MATGCHLRERNDTQRVDQANVLTFGVLAARSHHLLLVVDLLQLRISHSVRLRLWN